MASSAAGYIRAVCHVCKSRPNLRYLGLQNSPKGNRLKSTTSTPDEAFPIDDYYSLLLSQPLPSTTSAISVSSKPQEPTSANAKNANLQKARVIFGSRLAGPVERRRAIDSQSSLIAGVLVPPRPLEPDNCCMSGCVNCVWDIFRDDLEEWASKDREARRRSRMAKSQNSEGSMDDNGGGSETYLTTEERRDLFEGIPVGIREFMRTEKALKERHQSEGTRGG